MNRSSRASSGSGLLPALAVALAGSSLWAPGSVASAQVRPHYRIEATIAPGKPQIEGIVEVTFTNTSPAVLHEVVVFLFPNRFSAVDPELNDFTRQFLYPEKEFDPGSMQLVEVRDAGALTSAGSVALLPLPPNTAVRIPIADLAPGATRTLTLRFRAAVPHRFGTFGEFEQQLTLIGGWYPYLANLSAQGEWGIDEPPQLADFDVDLSAPSGLEMVVNGRYVAPGAPGRLSVPAVHYLSLVAAPQFVRDETDADGTRIVLLRPPEHLSFRISPEASPTDTLLSALRDVIVDRPAAVPSPPAELVVVEAPLRLDLTAQGEGDVLVSDRILKLAAVLRPFHELQLAQAVYAELLRPTLAEREPATDYYWVSEGIANVLAERFMNHVVPVRRSVYYWIDLFNIFALVDRFESVPNIPFVQAFFPRAKDADPLHAQITTFNRTAPPGRVVLGKLGEQIGGLAFNAMLDRCLLTPEPFRQCATGGDPEIAARLAEWTAPYPAISYRIESTDFNEREDGTYRSTVTIRRVSSRPFTEPVAVRFRTIGGASVQVHWKQGGEVAVVSATTQNRVYQVVIDPDRRLIDDDRSDNAWPPRPQLVLDSADVEISSTEFGFSALAVLRERYDYRKDLAVAGFYTNRGIGFTAGGRLHWGEPIDATRFRNNIYGFYTFEALDSGFTNKGQQCGTPNCNRTSGHIGGFGLRYDYSNVLWTDDPSDQRRLRIYADWFDRSLGSDFDYGDWGYTASATTPLWSPRTIGAVQLFNGFSKAFNSIVPNQGEYSLGGSLSIRGIGAEDQLGRNIAVVRTELRQSLYPELDLNLLDLLVLRNLQAKLLVDAGQVSNSVGRIYDVGSWACGAGVGVTIIYDVLGFFTSAAYFEIATRVDEPSKAGDIQFLFGSGQEF